MAAAVSEERTRRWFARAVLAVAIAMLAGACQPVVADQPVRSSSFEGVTIRSFVPSDPIGIVYLFHGTGGSSRFAEKIETVDLTNLLVANGYGYVATTSSNRSTRQWDNTSLSFDQNEDLAHLARLHDDIVSSTAVDSSTPIFAVGMSNGASMSVVFAQAFADAGYPVAAAAAFNGPVPASVRRDGPLTVPTLFHLSENDTTVNNDRIRSQHEALVRRGIDSRLITSPELPLVPRFTRIPTVDVDEQAQIMTVLRDSGVWDDDGTRIVTIPEAIERLTPIVNSGLPASLDGDRAEIRDQLAIILGEHQFSSLFRTGVLDFFAGH